MDSLFIILLITIIFRPIRRIVFSNIQIIIASFALFAVGYWVGESLSNVAGPAWLKWLGGALFVVEGLPEVLKYFDEIGNRGR